MRKLIIILYAFIFTACSTIQGEYMSVRKVPVEPVAGKAMIYFMRSDSEYYNFQIWDGEKLIAILENASYTQYIADPGKHTFMAALGADYRFIEADLAPGKTYYIRAFRKGFFLIPYFAVIKKDHKWWAKIPRWKKKHRNLDPMEAELQMGEDSRIVRAKQLYQYFENNKEKLRAEKRLTVIAPEDGETTTFPSVEPVADSPHVDLNDGLVAYYPFNGNADDESGNGHDGRVNGAVLTSGRLGDPDSAYSFDGNDAIKVAHNKTLDLNNSFSVSVWFYSTADPIRRQRLLGKGRAKDGNTPSWSLTLNKHGGVTFFWESADDADHKVKTRKSLEYLKFNHVVAVFDSKHNTNRIYVNGARSNMTGAYGDLPGKNRAPLIIGIRRTPSVPDRPFFGTIDDVRIYNRALSEREIQELYSGDAPGKLSLHDTDQ